jgi:DNA repair protein RadC
MADNTDRTAGHRSRLRKRFLSAGLERFSDEEVVEFLLSLGTPRKDVKLPARETLARFGSISGVLSASLEELTEVGGIGTKNALYLKFIHDVAGRYLKDRAIGKPFFGSSKDIFDYLFHSMRDLTREVFRVLFLNRKNELIGDEDLFMGTLTGSAVYPREIMTHSLQHNAAALVCVHNHPSGDPSPSPEDRRLTRDLIWTGKLLGIQILDHIIIGHNTYFSFADDGLVRRFSSEYSRWFQDL